MNKDAVQHERGPRNSTLRRQMSLYFKEQQHHQLNLSQPLISSSDRSPPPTLSAMNGKNGSSNSSTPTALHSSRMIPSRIPTSSISPPSKETLDLKQNSTPSALHHHLSMLAANETAMASVANRHSLFMHK